MATVIKSISDLTRIIELRVQKALEMTQQEIFEVIQEHITDYYKEYNPIIYQRTWKFLNSLIKTDIIKSPNGLSCTVEIDENYLSYRYKGEITGLEVSSLANKHSHGGIYDDDFVQFWDDSMQDLGMKPGILAIMKRNLKKCRVPIQ